MVACMASDGQPAGLAHSPGQLPPPRHLLDSAAPTSAVAVHRLDSLLQRRVREFFTSELDVTTGDERLYAGHRTQRKRHGRGPFSQDHLYQGGVGVAEVWRARPVQL